ncbi:hypothetical protein RG963_11485 [Methanosarcina sp. Z-7115]|uniref:Uncharacterized protein n=1 Tax=Methanosarcina baikalica TaxID=3073890 RepID=A0ABU2D331_9EURY|nr:hypothetical protein [Methanosarcina sp. Z-7115]MDR7666390.1 hypothetical protein [Methanosarcina sp. Z-7115]
MAEHQYEQQPKKTDTIAQKQTTPSQSSRIRFVMERIKNVTA